MLKLTLSILGPQFINRRLVHNATITAATLKYVKRDLLRCGLVLARLSDLQTRVTELVGLKLEIAKKTKGAHTNIYINHLITDASVNVDGDQQDAEDDSVPF